MVKYSIIYVLLLLLTGCHPGSTRTIVQEVKVPVNICPKPVELYRPVLPIMFINNNTNDEDVVKSYKQTVKVLQNYSIKLEKALEVYK